MSSETHFSFFSTTTPSHVFGPSKHRARMAKTRCTQGYPWTSLPVSWSLYSCLPGSLVVSWEEQGLVGAGAGEGEGEHWSQLVGMLEWKGDAGLPLLAPRARVIARPHFQLARLVHEERLRLQGAVALQEPTLWKGHSILQLSDQT